MITVYTQNKEIEGAPAKHVQLQTFITEDGQEYIIMRDIGHETFLYKLQRSHKEYVEFCFIDKIERVEAEPERKKRLIIANDAKMEIFHEE
jgi:hypothetical protein